MKEVYIEFIDQLDIIGSCGIGDLEDTINKICLLYTSPSPRD